MFSASRRRLSELNISLPLIAIVAIAIIITIWHLGSSPASLSPSGESARAASVSLSGIYHNPVYMPHKLLLLAASQLDHDLGILRLASYVAALIFAFCFYKLSKGLFGRFVGCLSVLIFCLSAFFIIPSRQVSAQILLFAPVALMALYVWFIRTEKTAIAWLILAVAAGLLVYTPGIILWLVGGAIICRKKLLGTVERVPAWVVGAGAALFLLLLIPAAVSIVHNWRHIDDYLLIPGNWPAPLAALKSFGWMILSLFVRTPHSDTLVLGRLPLLDMIQTALIIFGVFALWTAAPKKVYTYGGAILLALVVAAVNDDIELLLLGLPALGLLMAAGLRYLYVEWRSIFPLNPIAKYVALVCMIALVAVQLVYGLRYSLQAWPDSAATKHTYMLK